MQEDSEAGFCAVSSQTELKLLAGQGWWCLKSHALFSDYGHWPQR
jgi:hypothetical protein